MKTLAPLLLLLAVGCPDKDETDTRPHDTGSTDDSGETGETNDTSPFTGEDCKSSQGVCTSSDRCPEGQEIRVHADDCTFDDGPGVCCRAPQPTDSGETCEAYGGVCAPISGCGMVDGWHADGTCEDPWAGLTCCVPEGLCGVQEDVCCGDGVAYVPTCDRGNIECNIEDTELVPEDECPV